MLDFTYKSNKGGSFIKNFGKYVLSGDASGIHSSYFFNSEAEIKELFDDMIFYELYLKKYIEYP